jgi:biopolymer transport protein ExbD
MKKIIFISAIFLLISCNKEQVQLPKSDRTILKDIKDHSPVYMFFRVNEKDTTVKVNRQNTISSTNWVYNVDKRLPLKLVIPEINKLQEKKRSSSHKKEGAIDVFSYADSIGNNLAFIPFTKMQFKTRKPLDGIELFLNKEKEIFIDGKLLPHNSIEKYLEDEVEISELSKIYIAIDENANFDLLLKTLLEIQTLEIKRNYTEIYIY